MDVKELDYEYFTLFATTTNEDITEKCSEAVVYIDALKIWAKVVVVQIYDTKTATLKSTQIYFCADKQMQGKTVLEYYHLRFQIEFLFRDAKQHLGLNQCQSTDEKVLHNHWNTALTTINIAKALQWQQEPNVTERIFPIQDIKTLYFNQLYLDKFSAAFGIDTESDKYSDIAKELLTCGKMAA